MKRRNKNFPIKLKILANIFSSGLTSDFVIVCWTRVKQDDDDDDDNSNDDDGGDDDDDDLNDDGDKVKTPHMKKFVLLILALLRTCH